MPNQLKTQKELMDFEDIQGHDLASYAAQDAAQQLTTNWEAAIRDGSDLRELVNDVDEVVRNLQEWKKAVISRLEAGNSENGC